LLSLKLKETHTGDYMKIVLLVLISVITFAVKANPFYQVSAAEIGPDTFLVALTIDKVGF
jgi:hypothetical protein